MRMFTKKIETKLQRQFNKGSSLDQLVICRIFNPYGGGEWFIMNQDPEDPNYLWGIANVFEVEMGSISKTDLETIQVLPGCGLERDKYFKPVPAREIWEKHFTPDPVTEGSEEHEVVESVNV